MCIGIYVDNLFRSINFDNEENSKKCNSCKGGFGILEKKTICACCNSILCNNCSKNEVFIYLKSITLY